MDSEFSEIQFQCAVVGELMNTRTTVAKKWKAPIMPTTREENGLGYDCKIEGPIKTLFFQFKTSRELTKAYANHWGLYMGNYYEFDIRPLEKSSQHNDLVDLANSDSRFRVFYCAPGFIKNSEYQDYYTRGEIIENSIFVPCKQLVRIRRGETHTITFVINPRRRAKMHSEVYNIKSYGEEEFWREVEQGESFKNLEECVTKLSKAMKIDVNREYAVEEQLERMQVELMMRKNICMVVYQ